MRVISALFLSCFLLGLLASTGNSQLIGGQGILPTAQGNGILSTAQGTSGSTLTTAPTINDALTNILGPLLGGNSNNGGQSSILGNLGNVLAQLQSVSVGGLLQGILNGDVSGLGKILGSVIELLQSLPIVGPLIILLSQVLNIPLTLVASIVALLLDLLVILLNITRTASG